MNLHRLYCFSLTYSGHFILSDQQTKIHLTYWSLIQLVLANNALNYNKYGDTTNGIREVLLMSENPAGNYTNFVAEFHFVIPVPKSHFHSHKNKIK